MPGDCVLSPGINLLSLYPLFSLFSFFGFILISCNSHGCIGLDVIVVQRIVVFVEAGRAEERKCLRGNGLRRGDDDASLQVDLGICCMGIVLRQSGLFVEDVAAEAYPHRRSHPAGCFQSSECLQGIFSLLPYTIVLRKYKCIDCKDTHFQLYPLN